MTPTQTTTFLAIIDGNKALAKHARPLVTKGLVRKVGHMAYVLTAKGGKRAVSITDDCDHNKAVLMAGNRHHDVIETLPTDLQPMGGNVGAGGAVVYVKGPEFVVAAATAMSLERALLALDVAMREVAA